MTYGLGGFSAQCFACHQNSRSTSRATVCRGRVVASQGPRPRARVQRPRDWTRGLAQTPSSPTPVASRVSSTAISAREMFRCPHATRRRNKQAKRNDHELLKIRSCPHARRSDVSHRRRQQRARPRGQPGHGDARCSKARRPSPAAAAIAVAIETPSTALATVKVGCAVECDRRAIDRGLVCGGPGARPRSPFTRPTALRTPFPA